MSRSQSTSASGLHALYVKILEKKAAVPAVPKPPVPPVSPAVTAKIPAKPAMPSQLSGVLPPNLRQGTGMRGMFNTLANTGAGAIAAGIGTTGAVATRAAKGPARVLDWTGLTNNAASATTAANRSFGRNAVAGAKDVGELFTGGAQNNLAKQLGSDANLMRRQGSPGMADLTQGAHSTAKNVIKAMPFTPVAGPTIRAAAGHIPKTTSGKVIGGLTTNWMGEGVQPYANAIGGVDGDGVPNYPTSVGAVKDKYFDSPQQQSPQQQSPPQQSPQQALQAAADQQFDPVAEKTQQATALIKENPEAAAKMNKGLQTQVANVAGTEVGKQEVATVTATGALSPEGDKTAFGNLAKELPESLEQAKGIYDNMDGWGKFALWGGVGLGAIGLINAMTGEGGIGSWMMALLGLGTAATAAGHGGLLGESAQKFTQNATTGVGDMLRGEQKPPTGAETLRNSGIQAGMQMPDVAIAPFLKMIPEKFPDLAKELDTGAGVGGLQNSGMSYLGDVFGATDARFAKYGLSPEQGQRLLGLWTKYRQQP